MKITTATTTTVNADDIAEQLARKVHAALGDSPVDLCLLFASAHFEDRLDTLVPELHAQLGARNFVGTTAESVIADENEYESQPALVLWAASLPDGSVSTFHLGAEDVEQLESAEQLRDHIHVPAGVEPGFVLMGDPFSFTPTPVLLSLLEKLSEAYPGCPAIGGMASAGEQPGQNVLVFEGQPLRHGLVGVALWGGVQVEPLVSQGCRPIGRHLLVTRAEGNIIYELGGKPPLQTVKDLWSQVSVEDRHLLQTRGLLLGRVINEYQRQFNRGDFLIRNPLGFDADSGAMAVNDLVRTGQTVQFHVRDERSATADLEQALTPVAGRRVGGALLFSCNGRGSQMFRQPSHDARHVYDALGGIPAAGFFAAGEIGPVGDRNFVHGFTASIGVVCPREAGIGE